jgi:antitoxin YqcF
VATEENKKLARLVLGAFGGKPLVMEYLDDPEKLSVDIMSCVDRPSQGITSYATLGLSDFPMFQDENEFHVRLELLAACNTGVEWFPNMLASTAFYIMRTGWLCHPGAVLQNAIHQYAPDLRIQHLYFTAPFLWEDKLKTVQLDTKKVAWLLSVPITNAEYEYCKKNGDDNFEELLERKQVDIFDIKRSSAT